MKLMIVRMCHSIYKFYVNKTDSATISLKQCCLRIRTSPILNMIANIIHDATPTINRIIKIINN